MPKTISDYSKSVIYKLCCRDPTVEDIYVGSTTNFRQRKAGHKISCCNENLKNYNFYVYRFIRDNNGWENWDMVAIETYPCETKHDLHTRERYYIDLLKPTLNKCIPLRTVKEYYVDNKEQLVQQMKQYYIDNKEQLAQQAKQYYNDNKEQILQQKKQYKIDNKEQITQQMKQYYIDNKERLNHKTNCECGGRYTTAHKAKHLKSNKHLKYKKPN